MAQDTSATPAPTSAPKPEPLKYLPRSILDAELRSISGQMFKLSEYSGSVLVVHLWATWCGPCMHEAPVFVKLHKQFGSQGVRFVDLSTENPEVASVEVRRWIRTFGVPYRVGFATTDVAMTLMQGRHAIPQTFVISRSGEVLTRFVGFNSTQTPLKFEQAIKQALKEPLDTSTTP